VRIHFTLTPNIETVPFDYQNLLIGAFHKWMGWNKIHDEISLYSLSWLQGGKMNKDGFTFPKGARWFISFWDEEIGKQLIKNSMKESEVCCGMKVKEIQIQETPNFSNKEKFTAASPIFIRKYDDKRKATHLTYNDEESDKYLTETIRKKLQSANLNLNITVSFDRNYSKSKTKLVSINGIKNKANFCPVTIEGDPEAIQFAWSVGVGHSTGCGFGAII
jgi:CRISPR-associated endoribonuclease Cas6